MGREDLKVVEGREHEAPENPLVKAKNNLIGPGIGIQLGQMRPALEGRFNNLEHNPNWARLCTPMANTIMEFLVGNDTAIIETGMGELRVKKAGADRAMIAIGGKAKIIPFSNLKSPKSVKSFAEELATFARNHNFDVNKFHKLPLTEVRVIQGKISSVLSKPPWRK